MPQVIETVVYPIGELDDAAKDAARAWYRQHCMDHAWYDFVYEDFATGGATREEPHVYWTGFWSQADGACFEGTYSYARGAAASIRIHAPLDTRPHAIADSLQAVQRRNFYQCHARIEHRGRYCHEYSMAISAERDSPTWQPMTDDAEDTIAEASAISPAGSTASSKANTATGPPTRRSTRPSRSTATPSPPTASPSAEPPTAVLLASIPYRIRTPIVIYHCHILRGRLP